MAFVVNVGDVFRERDPRFVRFVKVVAFSEAKAVVVSSVSPDRNWSTKETKIRVERLEKRFTRV